MISHEKWMILTRLQKLPKNVEDWGKLILPEALKSCPKFKISPNLVTLGLLNISKTTAYCSIQLDLVSKTLL